jgi:hypothetical protein
VSIEPGVEQTACGAFSDLVDLCGSVQGADIVSANGGIDGHDRQAIALRLRNENAVEGIGVMQR